MHKAGETEFQDAPKWIDWGLIWVALRSILLFFILMKVWQIILERSTDWLLSLVNDTSARKVYAPIEVKFTQIRFAITFASLRSS
jgi:hypothetical protein